MHSHRNVAAFSGPSPLPPSLFTSSPSTLNKCFNSCNAPNSLPSSSTNRRRATITATQATTPPTPKSASPSPENKPSKASAKANGKKKSNTALGKLVVMGLSHHTATVDVREKLSVPEAEWQEAAGRLCELESVSEAAVLSTCNRFEVYIISENPFLAIQQTIAHLSSRSNISITELRKFLFMLIENEACWHLLRVSAGLDSLVIGEGQILSQVKKCYELSTDNKNGHAGKILTRLFNIAVSAGKRVRSETGISQGAVSISSAAVELSEHHAVPDLNLPLEDCNICILGAGKMSRLLVQHLISKSVKNITIVNRSLERAELLVKMFSDTDINISVDLSPNMMKHVKNNHIIFTSTSSDQPILTKDNLSSELIEDSKYMVIDISVPRNVSTDVNELSNVHSYNVDDLKAVVAKNQARRRKLILEAEKVLVEEQNAFNNWHNSLGCIPAISKLQQRAESIRQDEMDKVKGRLAGLSASERKAVEQLSKGIINKMLHSPMVHLRGLDDMEERTNTLRQIEALFKL